MRQRQYIGQPTLKKFVNNPASFKTLFYVRVLDERVGRGNRRCGASVILCLSTTNVIVLAHAIFIDNSLTIDDKSIGIIKIDYKTLEYNLC